MDHAHEFSTLGIGQIWAVDNPVIVTATVKAVFFPALMANISQGRETNTHGSLFKQVEQTL